MDQVKFVKDSLKKFEKVWSAFSSKVLKVVFHKFFSVHSRILCPKYDFDYRRKMISLKKIFFDFLL